MATPSLSLAAQITAVGSMVGTQRLPQAPRSGALAMLYAGAIAVFGGSAQFIVKWLIDLTQSPLAPAVYATVAYLIGGVAMCCSGGCLSAQSDSGRLGIHLFVERLGALLNIEHVDADCRPAQILDAGFIRLARGINDTDPRVPFQPGPQSRPRRQAAYRHARASIAASSGRSAFVRPANSPPSWKMTSGLLLLTAAAARFFASPSVGFHSNRRCCSFAILDFPVETIWMNTFNAGDRLREGLPLLRSLSRAIDQPFPKRGFASCFTS